MKIVPHTFQNKLQGLLGDFWQNDVLNEIDKVKTDIAEGKITIDDNGVAYNCIGRVLMDDLAEVVEYVTDKIDREATAKARAAEVDIWVKEYRRNPLKLTDEDIFEMKAAFDLDEKVVDVVSGQVYYI